MYTHVQTQKILCFNYVQFVYASYTSVKLGGGITALNPRTELSTHHVPLYISEMPHTKQAQNGYHHVLPAELRFLESPLISEQHGNFGGILAVSLLLSHSHIKFGKDC